MRTRGGSRRRTACAAGALVASVAGVLFHAKVTSQSVFDYWWAALALWWTPPAVVAAMHRRRGQRAVCVLAAAVEGLLAVVLTPFGYGVLQYPAVALLVIAAMAPDDAHQPGAAPEDICR